MPYSSNVVAIATGNGSAVTLLSSRQQSARKVRQRESPALEPPAAAASQEAVKLRSFPVGLCVGSENQACGQ